MTDAVPEAPVVDGAHAGRRAGAGVLVAAVTIVALLVRTTGALDAVVRPDGVVLQGADAWHHLRQIEQLVRHFPRRMTFDPYGLFPGGQGVTVAPLFDYLVATVSLLVGALSPSARTIALVTAWSPAILGALTSVPVYLLARRAAGRAAGLLAAVVIAVLPGQFLSRTVLGFADHHALESLLAAVTVLALAAALAQDTRGAALRRACGAGLVLLLYLLTWTGGALLVLVLGGFAVVQVNVEHARGAGGGRTGAVTAAFFATTLAGQAAVGWDLPYAHYQRLALLGALVAAAGLGALAHVLARGHRSRVHLPMATLAVAAGGAAVIASVSPQTLRGGWHALTWFAGSGLQETVGEAAPLLRMNGSFSLARAWAHFGTALPAALIALALLARRIVREGRPIDALLAVWSLAMLLATLGQNRFGYYFAACAAVLCGVLIGPPLARLWDARDGRVPAWVRRVLWPSAAVIALVVPVAPVALMTTLSFDGPRDAWLDALRFLRDETPGPFDDAGYFDEIVAAGDARLPREGVLAWWDAGYWITTIGRRAPASNPTQAGAREVAELLLMTNPDAAADACLERGLSLVVLDGETPILQTGPNRLGGELGQVARWADIDPDELFRTYHRRDADGSWQPLVLFEPAYYETLAVRLHVFGGKLEVPVRATQIVRWREVRGDAGAVRLEITDLERFDSFARAAKTLERALAAGEQNVRIVSDDPLSSCVPLEPATRFRRVFASQETVATRLLTRIPDVQIYEVLPD